MLGKLLVCLFVTVFFSVKCFACACCADAGTYSIFTKKPDSYLLGVFREMKFAKEATLFTSDAGVDPINVKGLPKDYNDDNYQAGFDNLTLGGGFSTNKWTMDFTDYKGRKGSLVLPLQNQMLKFAVDLEPQRNAPNTTLYKEFRFQGIAKGTGFLQPTITPNTKYFLVFRGKGNSCDNAQDFNYWRLEITGTKASYAFWGRLEQ
ncbi:MAG: hypothetical protein K1X72_03405 [Pyrinomonadaceae bacterium]|nr:hypothetical protein [Pyrinomonadaceae bacterium]